MKRFLSLPLLCLALLFGLTACDSGGSNGEEVNNEFSFTITPTSSSSTTDAAKRSQKDLNGFSFFVDTDDLEETQEQSFVIYLSGGESKDNLAQGLFGFVARQSTQPNEGTYDLADLQDTPSPSDFIGALYEDVENISTADGAPYYFVRSGTLNIQESSDNEVSGELTATATEYTIEGSGTDVQISEQSVEITGQFTAKNLDTFVPFDQYTSSPNN